MLENPSVFGLNVHLRRTEMGISQRELARRIGVSNNVICMLESGRVSHLSLPAAHLCAKALDVSLDLLMTNPGDAEEDASSD